MNIEKNYTTSNINYSSDNNNHSGYRKRFANLFWFRCHANTFRIPVSTYKVITEIANSKLRASAYKLYRWLCFCSDSRFGGSVSAQMKKIRKEAGLSKPAIIAARKELVGLALIRADLEAGPGGRYYLAVMNPDEPCLPLDWNKRSSLLYLCAPVASVLPDIYAKKWTGTDALVYDALCMEMGRSGQSDLPKKKAHWLPFLAKNTLLAAERHLVDTGFIRLKTRSIEMLHPETSKSMPPRAWEQEASEHSYFYDSETGARKVFSEELLTPEVIEQYFIKSLPRATEWRPGYDAHCPFHHDEHPSLSINVETGQFCCHGCGIAGNKLVTFEMRLLDLEDRDKAWVSVAKKIGFRASPRSHGKETHRHVYRDHEGFPYYEVRRYQDGSARYFRTDGIFPRSGLGKRKRILYNLPEVISADVVLVVEGEKKADILTSLGLLDCDGMPVAVTCTGGADSWRSEFVEHLRGKRVLLLPDADEPGQRYSSSIQASLQRAEVEYSVVAFGDYGNDVRDFLNKQKYYAPDELVTFVGSAWLRSPVFDCSPSKIGEEICI